MKLFDFLHVQDARVTPQSSKVHLSSFNGTDEPLDVYLRGNFDEWQSEPLLACAEFGGRLVVSFTRSGRASYLIGENWT